MSRPPTEAEKLAGKAEYAQTMLRIKNEWDEFNASPEGLARIALMKELQTLQQDERIAKSEACVELLDAFHKCLDYHFQRRDAAGIISYLTSHFDAEKAAKAARERANNFAEKDAAYREFLAKHLDKKPMQQKKLLREHFALPADQAHGVVRRFRDSRDYKNLTAASTRKPRQPRRVQNAPPDT